MMLSGFIPCRSLYVCMTFFLHNTLNDLKEIQISPRYHFSFNSFSYKGEGVAFNSWFHLNGTIVNKNC